jgi:hypothetical protein
MPSGAPSAPRLPGPRCPNWSKAAYIAASSFQKERCSLSTFVTIAWLPGRVRNVPSLSSASTTQVVSPPQRTLPPNSRTSPPTNTHGSVPVAVSRRPSIAVVVVLPCVPATSTLSRVWRNFASISVRWSTGMPRRHASWISGFSRGIALETTTTSQRCGRFSAAW